MTSMKPPTLPQAVEARARELLADEVVELLRGQVGGDRESVLYDLQHRPTEWQLERLAAIQAALSPDPRAVPAVAGEAWQRLSSIAADIDTAVAGGMSWISHSEAYEFSSRIRRTADMLAALTRADTSCDDRE